MTQVNKIVKSIEASWHQAMLVDDLELNSALMKRINGRQIAFFKTNDGIRACDNRCPHEGYPLSEGSVSGTCTLTCNWHNWKFDLESGENLLGGDRLRTYLLEERNGELWIDLQDPPYEQRYQSIVKSLRDAYDDYSYDRVAREIARLIKLGADPLDCLRLSIKWSWPKMEYGWTHAFAGMADWLVLYHELVDDEEGQLICLVEAVTHCSYDCLREPDYAYPDDIRTFDEGLFLQSIETEDEKTAMAFIRGGLRDGLEFNDFEPALSKAALRHYNDFGHSIIYVTKIKTLINGLGDEVSEGLLLSLVRGIIYASREDKVPEFRDYASQIKKWGHSGSAKPESRLWKKKSINRSMKAVIDCSDTDPQELYCYLLKANAMNLLGFDLEQQYKTHVTVSGNVGWLDFTHGITFASAVRQQCIKFPELWPSGLLQMACFNGRNAAFTNFELDLSEWYSKDIQKQIARLLEKVLDHGQVEHIVSVHLLKTLLSVRDEIEHLNEDDAGCLVAAVTRFIESPLKRRQVRRTAYQSLQFVAKE
jgi:nitrite reductase/ring-hydroxylating ferredoxin subunit